MGAALIRGVLAAGLLPAEHIMVLEPDQAQGLRLRAEHGVILTDEPAVLAAACRILVFAVKPQIMDRVLAGYRDHVGPGHLAVSIAAGIPIARIEAGLGPCGVIRVMPNTPALVLAGASALSPNGRVSDEDLAVARRIFEAIGVCVVLPEEQLDAVTGLSGSGPGYVFTFIEAMIDAGVRAGLARPVAESLTLQTIHGSVKMAMETGEHPAALKARVTSPGGTTIAGLHVLESAGLRGAVMSAVLAATERSRELGG